MQIDTELPKYKDPSFVFNGKTGLSFRRRSMSFAVFSGTRFFLPDFEMNHYVILLSV